MAEVEEMDTSSEQHIERNVASDFTLALLKGTGISVFKAILQDRPIYHENKIESITKQHISEVIVHTVIGTLNYIIKWMKNAYIRFKCHDRFSKKVLHDLLKAKVEDTVIPLVSQLRQEEYADSIFDLFTIGANIHLMLLQELAVVDPDHHDPSESPYVKELQKVALEYANYGQARCEKFMRARLSMIGKVEFSHEFHNQGAESYTYYSTLWVDHLTETYYDDFVTRSHSSWHFGNIKALLKRTHKERDHYITEAINVLTMVLNDPLVVLSMWKVKLQKHPLPKTSEVTLH